MNVCPICKSYNFIKITSNSKENIKLTDNNYSYNKCLNCFVISQNPLPNHSTLNKHYKFLDKLQANKKNYPKKLSILFKIKDSYQKHNFQNFLRDFFKFGEKDYTYFNILNPGNILDLGAGNGIFSIAAKQKGFEVISIEQNETSINFAEKLGVKIVPADINSQSTINYASQVDNITLNHVLEHVKQPINFLNTLKNNIKQKAKIVIVVPNSDSIWRYIFREKWYGWDPPVHVHLYNQRSLRIIMTQIGMEIEYLKSLNRIDSLYSALIHAGYKVKRFKLFLRVISLPLLPILKVFNISPEIICVVKKK
tara:strand:- start:192 stop:1118 length:927 start_codon:yes stop_codon:yes gene_type:complete